MRPFSFVYMCLLLFSGWLSGEVKAQNAPAPALTKLTWQGYEMVLPNGNMPGKIPSFSGASLDYVERLPYYKISIPNLRLQNFILNSTSYEPFSADDAKLFDVESIHPEPAISIVNATENKVPVAIVTILPIRRNKQTGRLEKLISFSYTYTSQTTATQSTTARKAADLTNSVLSSGNWYKLGVTSSGIHRIDKATLLALGINTQNLDPKTIQLFGNGGGMLPQANSAPRPSDLQENAIWVSGEADGKFDDTDYVLFYAQGPHTWTYNADQKLFKHNYNIYSDSAYYFLRVGYTSSGARISSKGQAANPSQSISTYNERLFHEKDLRNMVYSGREWYGEEFSSFTPNREITFPVSDVVAGSEVKLTATLMANSPAATTFTLKLNNQLLGTQSINGRGTYEYHPEGVNSIKTYTINQQDLGNITDLKASLAFAPGGSTTAIGYLNYLQLNFERQLKLFGEQTSFRSIVSLNAPVSTFKVSNVPANTIVWDVTDPLRPVLQQTILGSDLTFSAVTSVLREFVVFQQNITQKPTPLGKVANQNLHSHNLTADVDFVIVTHPKFLQEANRLAAHRSKQTNMNVLVATTTQIYNEFSSGAQDVTAIRDYVRLVYNRSNKSGSNKLYLLLFGDTSYDYKNRLFNNTNFVPVYQSRQSLHPITSYSSEDYYGFMDEEEGEWEENSNGDHLLDIGIGRLPAKTATEAAALVNKIITYESPTHFGEWRNQLSFVADDGDFNEHQNDAEYLANYVEQQQPRFNTNKLYLDLFRQEAVANGQRSPEAVAAIENAVQQGSLILNYTGHGNEISWASEQLLTIPQINNLRNKDRLTFMLTATCEFGRYDDPERSSGAEAALLNSEGGAVGLITTTRPVYSSGNRVLNRNFFKGAFTSVNGQMPRLGDLVLLTKNNSITDNTSGSRGVNNRNFTLLSDPSLQLAYPALQAKITHMNGREITTDTLRALEKVTLTGIIATANGTIAQNFDGKLHITVFEKQTVSTTFGDENASPEQVKQRKNILYDGQASVSKGLFQVNFVVPKDINYQYGSGKISLYASNATTDAAGGNNSIHIGGSANNISTDNTPPTIKLHLNDESFVSGGHTGQNPVLLAKIFDENGINTAGISSGHELSAILDENSDNKIFLNDYYTSDVDNYQSGTIKFALKDVKEGAHTIKLKAWDTYNNSTEEYIEFFVSNNSKIALEHLVNHPNPFSSKTTFHFDHNRAGEDLDIQIQIFTISGKLIKTLQTTSYSSKTHVAELTWDGRDEYKDMLARGVYVYKVNVRSHQDGAKVSKFEKLVILN
ncbi:type IX secretion system sortase PorU [Pontibacter vulgaris]|uniref:type IX secretion system sortase PorU n=1 Tax=Pontibacter vulgaris TaxID=2905679 RepID=UPI001FA765B1|nr:type IX secretion system sortase PorU [Pontibacter vulgaris]